MENSWKHYCTNSFFFYGLNLVWEVQESNVSWVSIATRNTLICTICTGYWSGRGSPVQMLIYVPGGVTKWHKCVGPAGPFPFPAPHQCLLLLPPTTAPAPRTAPRQSPASAAASVPVPTACLAAALALGRPSATVPRRPPPSTNMVSRCVSGAYPSHLVQMP
jgi:hypothetical protein